MSKLGSVCRRVYRIFSHAYFHHRKIFDEFEGQRHLCNRFTQFVTKYALMSVENLLVPFDEAGTNVDSNVVAAAGGGATAAAGAGATTTSASASAKCNVCPDADAAAEVKQSITSDGGAEQGGESDA